MAKTEKKQNNSNSVFWLKGDGAIRRERNIDKVKELIISGFTYQQIVKMARKNFSSRTIDEYYDIASDEVKNGIDEEPFMDYVKRRKKEQKEEK